MVFEKKSDKAGMIPGSLVYVGNKKSSAEVQIELIEYNESYSEKRKIKDISECQNALTNNYISWVNIDGTHSVDLIQSVGETFKIHPLIMEDILNTTQRPKIEINDDYIYVTLKMVFYDNEKETFTKEQLSIIFLKNLIVTIQEIPGDVFDNIRERVLMNKGRVRKMGADYLLYSLIDAIVDEYFKIVDRLEIELESIEENINSHNDTVQEIHWLKKELLYVKRAVFPVREILTSIMKDDHPFINDKTSIYFRDIYDHCIQIHESVEIIRDVVSGLIEIQLSSTSNKMNEVMKYLAVFTSTFIPLTFITSIYGMNFEFMPELKWQYGYFYVLGLLFFTGMSLLWLFKKNKWL